MVQTRQGSRAWDHHAWTEAAGHRLHAAACGDARSPAVVLVHGQGVSHRYLRPVARCLSRDARVVAVDLPGFGLSPYAGEPLDVQGLADVLVSWLRATGLEGAVVVGHSVGCQVVVDAAVRHPGSFGPLVLVGATVDRRARTWARQAARLLGDLVLERPDLLPVLVRDYLACGSRRFKGTFDHMLADRLEDKVGLLRQPVLLVRGGLDPVSPRRWNLLLLSRLVEGEFVEVPWGGHNVGWSRPGATARVLGHVLAAAAPRAGDPPPGTGGRRA